MARAYAVATTTPVLAHDGEGLLERCERLHAELVQMRRTLSAVQAQSDDRLAALNVLMRAK